MDRKVERILVCKLRHHGDVLLTSPLLSALKEAYPSAEIDVYIYKETAPMLEGHPAIRKMHFPVRRKGVFRLLEEVKTLRSIRKERYDLVINLTEGDRGALAAYASGAPIRIGFDPGKSGFFFKKKIYTRCIEHCPNPKHTVEKNLDALRVLGINPSEEARKVSLFIDEATMEKMAVKVSGPFILVHPVSRWMFKCLSPKKMAEVINALPVDRYRIVVTTGKEKGELSYIEALKKWLAVPVTFMAGETTPKEFAALVKLCSLLITPDSLPLHIASAFKQNVVSFFGPTSEKNWGPWQNENARIITKKVVCRPCFRPGCAGSQISDCLETLDIRAILESAYELLDS